MQADPTNSVPYANKPIMWDAQGDFGIGFLGRIRGLYTNDAAMLKSFYEVRARFPCAGHMYGMRPGLMALHLCCCAFIALLRKILNCVHSKLRTHQSRLAGVLLQACF